MPIFLFRLTDCFHICHEDWQKISADGVHPTYDRGAEVIGKIYADYVGELVK